MYELRKRHKNSRNGSILSSVYLAEVKGVAFTFCVGLGTKLVCVRNRETLSLVPRPTFCVGLGTRLRDTVLHSEPKDTSLVISVTYTYFVSVSSKKLGLLTSFRSISLDDKFE